MYALFFLNIIAFFIRLYIIRLINIAVHIAAFVYIEIFRIIIWKDNISENKMNFSNFVTLQDVERTVQLRGLNAPNFYAVMKNIASLCDFKGQINDKFYNHPLQRKSRFIQK